MKKIICGVCVVIISLGILSCGEKDRSSINPGLYEIEYDLKYEDQPIIVKQRIRYTSDSTYEATTFNNGIAVEELKGKYKVENNQLVSTEKFRRVITRDGTWATWYSIPDSSVELRKISENSFEFNFKAPNDKVREQYKMIGITEGWKTYSRISG